MDRKTICEAQAAICQEQAGRGDSDRSFWLAEARRWRDLAGERAHAAISFDTIGHTAQAQAQDCEAKMRSTHPSRRN